MAVPAVNYTTAFLKEKNEVVVYLDHLYVKTRTGRIGQVNCKISFTSTYFNGFHYSQRTIGAKERASSVRRQEKPRPEYFE